MKLNFLSNLFKKSQGNILDKLSSTENQVDFSNRTDAKILLDSGKVKAKAKDYHGAISNFSKSLELDPTDGATYLERSKARREIKDNKGADQDIHDAGVMLDRFDMGLKAYDDAGEFYDKEDYKNAIKNYNKAITSIPSLTDVYYNRGISKQMLNDFDGAFDDFSKGIELDASNKAEAYYQRSKIKRRRDDKKGALQDLNNAIELNPNDADFYYSRAILQDDYDGLQDLNVAAQLEPNNPNIYFFRCLKKKGMEDYEGSLQDLNKFININSDDKEFTNSDAYNLMGSIKFIAGDYQASLQSYEKAVELDQSNTEALLNCGVTKGTLKDYLGAIKDLDKVIQMDSTSAEAFYHRGFAKQSLGMEDDGVMDVIKAKTLGYEE